MKLVNKKVKHKTFGKGNVVDYNDSYINIDFESGIKKFTFPDVFSKYATLIDERAADLVRKEIEEREEERKKEEIIMKREKELEKERQEILRQKKKMANNKIHPELQSVFWCKEGEEDEIFAENKVFIGRIKSGKKKGEPRRLSRMNQNSACLLTKREPDMKEEDRYILGAFLVEESFNGRSNEDGYIPAHPKYIVHLTEEESKKMLFWNYYVNRKFPDRLIWNSGRQRYFDNTWMAQILQDIVCLKEDPKEKEEVELFFKHFCDINRIDINELPKPNGGLNFI